MVTYLINGRSVAARDAYLAADSYARIAISAITQAEILFGLEKKPQAQKLRSTFEDFFVAVTILPWDTAVARVYGKLRARLTAVGTTLAAMDLLIASHALAIGAVLVTHDQVFRHAAPMLTCEDWATDL